MNRRTLLSVVAAATASVLLAGCAPRWVVHSMATPDPFQNQKDFAVLPIAFADLRVGVKSEQGYLADKTPLEQQAFYANKTALNEEYVRSLTETSAKIGIQIVPATGAQSAPFLIQPSVTSIDPGQGANWPSNVRMLVRIGTTDGKVFDTVEIKNRSSAYSPGDRLRNDGVELGKATAEYLKKRVFGG